MTAYSPSARRERRDWRYQTLEYLVKNPEPFYVQRLAELLGASQPIIYRIIETLDKEWNAVEEYHVSLKERLSGNKIKKDYYVLTLNGVYLLCYEERKRGNGSLHNDSFKEYVKGLCAKGMIKTLEKEKDVFIECLTEYEKVKNELSLSHKLLIGKEQLKAKYETLLDELKWDESK